MFGRNKEGRIYSPDDAHRASMDFLKNGTIPDSALGKVIWDEWRPREFEPASVNQIMEHNAVVSEEQRGAFQAKARRPLAARVGAAALSMVASVVK